MSKFELNIGPGNVIGSMAFGPGAAARGSVTVGNPRYMSAALPCAREDEGIAGIVTTHLRAAGVSVFYPPDHFGMALRRASWIAANDHDRLILLCSRATLADPHVRHIIGMVLEREAEAPGDSRIIPVSTDDYLRTWAPTDIDLQAVKGRVPVAFDPENAGSISKAIGKILAALMRAS